MSAQKMVSCICPTYGRPPFFLHLLEECVFWFLVQDYSGPRELLILNDCKEQKLVCDAPNVRIINVNDKAPTLGDKYNLMLTMAKGDIIMPWEDDDICLPGRISDAVICLEGPGGNAADYYNPQHTWYEESGLLRLDHSHGVCHNASAYRAGFMRYESISGAQDMYADGYAKQVSRVAPIIRPHPEQWQYVYRWGVSSWHLSGHGNTEEAYKRGGPTTPISGVYVIEPTMRKDYVTATRAIIGDN